MKVAIVTTRHGAQDDRIYYKQALSLAKHLDVTMIAPDDGEDLRWEGGVRFRSIPRRTSPVGRLLSILEAIIAVRKESPEFCHLHDLDLALAIPALRLLSDAKLIYDSHEVFTRDDLILGGRLNVRLRKLMALIVEAFENSMVKASHHVLTAVDPGNRAFRRLIVPQTTIFNYPPTCIFETNPSDVASEAKRYRDRLPIIYQGSMSVDRGLFDMLDALRIVKNEEPKVLLRLIGSMNSDLEKRTVARIREIGLTDNVEIDKWKPHNQIAIAMKTSLLGLVPLRPNEKYHRALPIKLLEYMACGLPVVSSSLRLVSRYLEESGAGMVYEPSNPESLANCVLELLSDPVRRKEMGEKGQRAVEDKWNWGRMEKALWQVYESLGAQSKEQG